MAIYHLRATMISRSQGRSATAASAYRVAERIEDRRTGLVFDYAARGGVDHTEILAPDHAPDWVHDRSELWNRVEESETRKNSQVAREVRVALPDELTHAQRVALVRDYAQAQFVDRGMVADIALHAPGREGDERNHHAHILLTTRELDAEGSVPGGGFTTKNRDWNKVEVLEGWREAWARDSNAALDGPASRTAWITGRSWRSATRRLSWHGGAGARRRGCGAARDRAGHVAGPPAPAAAFAGGMAAQGARDRGRRRSRLARGQGAGGRGHTDGAGADRTGARVAGPCGGAGHGPSGTCEVCGTGQSELALAGGRDGREEEPDLATGCATRGRRGRAVKRNSMSMRRSERHRRLRSRSLRKPAGFGGAVARGGEGR